MIAATEGTYALSINTVPQPLWGRNLRKEKMTKRQWQKLRARLIGERGMLCKTCGKEVAASRDIRAHERWEYDTSVAPAVARLTGIELVCWLCHAVEHFGVTERLVENGEMRAEALDETIDHFCAVNGVERSAFESHRRDAFARWRELSELEWQIDWGTFEA